MDTDSYSTRPDINDLAWKYRDILLDYLASPREQDRNAVFDFGYQAALHHIDLKQIIEVHHIVLVNLFAGARLAKETVRLAGELLVEAEHVVATAGGQAGDVDLGEGEERVGVRPDGGRGAFGGGDEALPDRLVVELVHRQCERGLPVPHEPATGAHVGADVGQVVLEVGGGCGSGAEALIERMGARIARYRFTDATAHFLRAARRRLGPALPPLEGKGAALLAQEVRPRPVIRFPAMPLPAHQLGNILDGLEAAALRLDPGTAGERWRGPVRDQAGLAQAAFVYPLAALIDAVAGTNSLIKVVDPAPKQIPAPESVKRALDLLRSAKRPLIILGKGAAYAQVDSELRSFIEKTGIPYLPMSMAKGLLPDTHEQCVSAARSFVLPGADVVMLIGARLNWLLSHGKGKTWGGKGHKDWGGQKFIQVDISPQEADSNVRIDAPLVGDIGSCVSSLLNEMKSGWVKPPAEWLSAVREKKTANVARMAETLAKNPSPMNFHSALNVVRDIVKANPDAILVNEGANALDFTRSIVDMVKPRKRLDVGTWGVMGIGMGFSVAAAVVSGQPVIAVEGDSAFGFSGMEVETLCRYDLPVCVVVLNNNGVYRGTDVDPNGRDPAPTVFVKGARYDKLIEAFGGVGAHATTPGELRSAMEQAIRSRKPTLINAVIDETAGTESGRITSLNPAAKKK